MSEWQDIATAPRDWIAKNLYEPGDEIWRLKQEKKEMLGILKAVDECISHQDFMKARRIATIFLRSKMAALPEPRHE